MRVNYKLNIGGYSGYSDGAVYYYHPKIGVSLVRSYPRMPHQAMNDKYAAIAEARWKLHPSEGYKRNFKTYCSILRDEDSSVKVASWYNLYVKMMWAMQHAMPQTVNLETITRAQIYEQDLPCKTVKMAVEAGLMPAVTGYENLTAEM